MKQKLSNLFAKAAKALGFVPEQSRSPSMPPQRTQKQREQRAFSAMRKMEVQREFEIQNAVNQPPKAKTPENFVTEPLEAVRDFKPIRTVRFKKPGENA